MVNCGLVSKEYFNMFKFDCKAGIDREVARYHAREIDVETLRTRLKRLTDLNRRYHGHTAMKARRRASFGRAMSALEHARSAFQSDQTIVAIDVGGKVGTTEISEVGITTYRRGEAVKTTTYVADYMFGSRDREGYFGPILVRPLDEVLAITHQAFEAAGLAVFHAAHCDTRWLKLDRTKTYYVDTSQIDRIWSGRHDGSRSLANLCAHYGVCNLGWHESGNDAYRTLLVLMHQIADATPPREPFPLASIDRADDDHVLASSRAGCNFDDFDRVLE